MENLNHFFTSLENFFQDFLQKFPHGNSQKGAFQKDFWQLSIKPSIKQIQNIQKEDLSKKVEICNQYLDAILEYNKKINIVTKKINKQDLLEKHLLDSLLALPFFFHCQKVADIGTGAGFPAIPLAIFLPNISFTLIESKEKKCLFLEEMKKKLKLNNITVRCQNINEVTEKFDIITCRAFAEIQKIRKITAKMVYVANKNLSQKLKKSSNPNSKETTYILYKGKKSKIKEEIMTAQKYYHSHQMFEIYSLMYNKTENETENKTTNEVGQERHLVIIQEKRN